jgi:hypothetical protein
MVENISDIKYLKDSIGKFKDELHRFIANPDSKTSNIIAIKHKIEDLEKNIIGREKIITNNILNGSSKAYNQVLKNSNNNTSGINYQNKTSSKFGQNNIFDSNFNPYITKSIINNDSKNKTYRNHRNFNNTFIKTNESNTQFINNKIYCDINKFLENPNYGNLNFDYLNNIIENQANNRIDIIPHVESANESYYDLIYKAKKKEIIAEYSTPQCENDFFRLKNFNKTSDNDSFKNMLILRRPKDNMNTTLKEIESYHKNRIENEIIMEKNNIKTSKTNYKKIKRSAGSSNYMDKSKIYKFSHNNKTLYNGVTFDKNKAPIITDDEVGRGVLSMINRGLIPKTADLTPAFNRNGHPITMSKGNELIEMYSKTNKRDELEDIKYNDKTKYNFSNVEGGNFFITNNIINMNNESMKEYINYNNLYHNQSVSENYTVNDVRSMPSDSKRKSRHASIDINNRDKDKDQKNVNNNINASITSNVETEKIYIKSRNYIKSKDNIKEEEDAIKIKNENYVNEDLTNNISSIINMKKIIEEENILNKNTYLIKMIIFKDFIVKETDDLKEFIEQNEDKIGTIMYLIEHYQKLFKKLNLTYAEVDLSKFEILVKDELQNVTNKDMIECLTEKDKRAKGFDNKITLHVSLKEAFVIRIQSYYRMHLTKQKYNELKINIKKIKKLQRTYRLHRIFKKSKILIEEAKKEKLVNWKIMMSKFKDNWKNIKKERRIEIHINSISHSHLRNCTFEKFATRENNQLNRMINLLDPNVEIIYVAPFPLANEVLSYYFSILSSLGIENAKERFHLIVPVINN